MRFYNNKNINRSIDYFEVILGFDFRRSVRGRDHKHSREPDVPRVPTQLRLPVLSPQIHPKELLPFAQVNVQEHLLMSVGGGGTCHLGKKFVIILYFLSFLSPPLVFFFF
jgi:hypothetical protein